MKKRWSLDVVLAWCVIALAPVPAGTAHEQIRAAMQEAVDMRYAAGLVTLVLVEGKIVHHEATGWADVERKKPMARDTLFWIASMTKSVSAAAVMTLVDEGRLSLDAPASQWLPGLRQARLASGPPAREITLRDLLSHTAGIRFPPRSPSDGAMTLAEYTMELIKRPLSFEPGGAYEYGFGITVAGRIAEIVSGQSFEELLAARIFRPLGMSDTTFHPDEAQRTRIARTYRKTEPGGVLAPAPNPFFTGDAGARHMPEPSGGLFSTAADMARFYQMILNGGELANRRVLSRAAVAEMTRPHLAGGKPLNYGLGWGCNTGRKPITALSARAVGHGGAFATHGWIDPETGLVAVVLAQSVLVPESNRVRDRFMALAAEAARR